MQASTESVTTARKGPQRGRFDEIRLGTLPEQTRKYVVRLVEAAAEADHIDEHGSWDFGIEFDKKKRGWALNWDLYGVGRDVHSQRLLVVIQIRQYVRHRANQQWPQIRKSYFLLGRNEDDTVFAHAVPAQVVRSAVKRGVSVVKASQDWMWEADYCRVVRQGDIGLVPVRRPAGEPIAGPIVLEHSHELVADELLVAGKRLYAQNPKLTHLPGTHPYVEHDGWVRVASARRGRTWDFAAPTVD